ncbi:hypothetical protein KW807_01220 [Candidatus Parcubacteria bacterium]|nr:hypothetical protein [Candidatus Parcubacteria bacterium]
MVDEKREAEEEAHRRRQEEAEADRDSAKAAHGIADEADKRAEESGRQAGE